MTPEFILALSGLLTGVVGGGIAIYTAQKAARRDEYEAVREEINRLQSRVEHLESDYERERRNNIILLDYIALLRGLMVAANIPAPKMPTLE